ncbi:40S ribosomal protein S12 [Tanacetum coccineum]
MAAKSLAHGGLVRGLHGAAKVIEKHAAQLCALAEDCDQPDYIKLVKALCADHNVSLLTVPGAKIIDEWAGVSLLLHKSRMGKGSTNEKRQDNQDAYLQLSITILAAFCRVPDIASSEDMFKKIPLILEVLSTLPDIASSKIQDTGTA